MEKAYTVKSIATALGVTARAVQLRAESESWPVSGTKKGRGGGKLFALASLPEDVRQSIEAYETKQALENAPVPYTLPASNRDEIPLKDWQREARDARLIVLETVKALADAVGGIMRAEKQFQEKSELGDLPEEMLDTIARANAKNGGRRSVKAVTLRLWRRTLKNKGKDGLAPQSRRKTVVQPSWLPHFVKLYCTSAQRSIKSCYDELVEAGVKVPHRRNVERYLKAELGEIGLSKGRIGPREYKKLQAYTKRKFDDLLPGDVYSADGHLADFVVLHPEHGQPVRPEIISVVDIATRRCVGWSVELFESTILVADAVRCSVEWAGIPAIFYVDNGCGFKNKVLSGMKENLEKGPGLAMLLRLGTKVSYSIPYNSQARGVIEVFNKNCWIRAARTLNHAYCGMDKSKELRDRHDKQIEKDLVEKGTTDKAMSWKQFLVWGQQQINEYNERPHSSLPKITDPQTGKRRHLSPNERWLELEPTADIIQPTEAELKDIFMPYVIRRVRRCLVKLFNQEYYSPALDFFHGQDVQVGFDIHDGTQVRIRDIEGKFVCIAAFDGHAVDYFPKSYVEMARENRTAQQLKRARAKESKILEQAKPALEAQPAPIVIDLPTQQKHEEFVRTIEAEREQEALSASQPAPPSEKRQRVVRALSIERSLDAGEYVNDVDAAWFGRYCNGAEYSAAKLMIDSFGEEAGLASLG